MRCVSCVKMCVVSAVAIVVVVAVVNANESVTATPVSDPSGSTDVAVEGRSTRRTIYLFPGTQTFTVLS